MSALVLKLISSPLFRSAYFVLIYLMIVVGNFYYFRPEKMMDNPSDLYYGDPAKIRSEMSGVLKDYIPVQMDYEGKNLQAQYQSFSWPAKTIVNLDSTHHKLYQFTLDTDRIVEFPVANFPHWSVEVDGQAIDSLTSETGLLAATIPAGTHTVGLLFKNSPVRNLADLISLTSLIGLLAYLLRRGVK